MSGQILAKDFVEYKSILNLIITFLNGRETLKDLKLHQKRPLIGTIYPSSVDLIYAAKGIPTYPIRMQSFGDPKIIHALDLGRTLFGDAFFTQMVKILRQMNIGIDGNFVDGLVQKLFDDLLAAFAKVYNIGLTKGISNDACFGIKLLSGMNIDKGKNLSAHVYPSIRCSAFEKTYETCAQYSKGIFYDAAPYTTPAAHELAVREIHRVAEELSLITGVQITNNSLRKTAEITNECKLWSERIIEIALGDVYPLHPKTFGEILSLIEIAFQDYMADPLRFRDMLRAIYNELRTNIQKGTNVLDVKKYPKILFTPRFGGWDHIVEDYAYESGARIIYADWIIYGFFNKVETTGDMYDNYATYIQNCALDFGRDNRMMMQRILDWIDNHPVDAVIYNQLFGCHSISTGYYRLRQDLMKREIPSTMIAFNQVGENREQLKTRIVALVELLKK